MSSGVYTATRDDVGTRDMLDTSSGGPLPAQYTGLLHRVHLDAVTPLSAAMHGLCGGQLHAHAFMVAPFSTAAITPHTLYAITDTGECAFLTCDASLLTRILDHQLGCEGMPVSALDEMSELTRAFLQESLSTLLPAYAQAWQPHRPLQFVRATPDAPGTPHTPAFIAEYAVTAPQYRGRCSIILPLPAWQPLLAACAPPPASPRRDLPLDSPLLQAIGTCKLPVHAVWGSTRICVDDLLGLQSGDIICLDQAAEAPVEIRIGGRPKLQGRAQVVDDHYCITVTPAVTAGETHGSE